jgi:serine/threonine-protein kinase
VPSEIARPSNLLGSVPLDSEEGRSFLQARISLYAKLSFFISGFFLVVGNALNVLFLTEYSVGALLNRSVLIHLAMTSIALGLWLWTRWGTLSHRTLAWLDLSNVVLVLSGYGWQLLSVPKRIGFERTDMVLLLITFTVLMARAVIVPSSARATFLISVGGSVPALVVGAILGRRFEAAGAGSASLAVPLMDGLWCAAAVGLATVTTRVIYGLRAQVVEAQRLGQYVLEEKIGEGGMGTVYRARHALLRRPTAIKLLPPDRAGAQTIVRIEREVKNTSMLSHPNTVAIFDYGRTPEGIFYYAMEYLEGVDLQRLVDQHGAQSPSRVVHIMAQMCGALGEAHGRGLVHRDVKPANALLCERGGVPDTVKVLDFGLVKDVGTPKDKRSDGDAMLRTDVNTIVGTPAYLAPEAIASPEDVDARSDLYAVGAVAYFLLVGEPVFVGRSVMEVCAKHLHDAPKKPSERLGKAVNEKLEAVILRCLEKKPDDRPKSAAEVRVALLGCGLAPWTEEDARQWWAEHTVDASESTVVPSASRSLLAIDLGRRGGRAA